MSKVTVVKPLPVEEELKKKTGITQQDISKLRQWLDTQPHLPGDLISDLDLILTYHCCDCSTAVTKEVLDLHLTLRSLFPIFKNRVVNDKLIRDCHIYLGLPLDTRTPSGSAVFLARLLDYDVKKFCFQDGVRMVLMELDLWQQEEGTWPGFEIVIDLQGLTLSHLARLDIQTIQQFLYYLQEAMLVKLKAVHFLSAPSFMDKLMMILRPFMKKALLDMIVIHQIGSKTIDKYVPIDALPVESGGKFKTMEQARDDMIARLKANAEFFVEENKRRVVEAKRPGRPKTISDIFGSVEGSFKKLDID